jgi:GR25 family glycosyltransferase involved in LPS biosynthesis
MFTRLICLIFSLIAFHLSGGFEKHLKPILDKPDIHDMRNIDFIYMINLDARPEKLAQSVAQLHPYGIYPYRFSAVNGWELTLDVINDVGVKFEPWMQKGMWGTSYILKDGELLPKQEIMHVPGKSYVIHGMARGTIGVSLSHLSILKDAYDSGYQTIWVMEDDIEVKQDPRMIPHLIDKLDAYVGEDNWDILFTDIDIKNREGLHVPCFSYAPRPNFTPADPNKFARRQKISDDFTQVGARYGGHSMIIRRSGMKKILDFNRQYSIFLPFDMDYILPPDMHLYSLNYDVVTHLPKALTDNGAPLYTESSKKLEDLQN